MDASRWSTQQLAEFVAAVSAVETEAVAARASVERAAEALDADVAAIVRGRELVAAVGYAEGRAPVDQLERVRPGVVGSRLDVPGVGVCAAAAATLDHPPGATLVVARPEALTREETGVLRGMARVASITMRMLRVLDDERAAREELERLAREQAALRRVATLVAKAASADEVFSAVAEEVAQLSAADVAKVLRYEPDGSATVVGGWGDPELHLPIGRRLAVAGEGVAVSVLRTGLPARAVRFAGPPGSVPDALRRAGVQVGSGSPILVEGRLWGVVIAARTRPDPLPPETERRLAAFTELVATAIANAQARVELRTVADEQAALRRVATLVARASPPADVFSAVAEEVGRLLRADRTFLARYDADDTVTVVASWSGAGDIAPVRLRRPIKEPSVSRLVRETGRPARIDKYVDDAGTAPAVVLGLGIRSAVAAPITVEGRLWGLMVVASTGEKPPPATEARLAGFTELVATAIANAEAHAELTASRARIVATADETRRRIERDLHDGAQQRLVSLALRVRAAQAAVPPELDELTAELDRVVAGLNGALDELHELARGIHPSILSEGGLGPALRTLTRRSAVPVELDVRTKGRLWEPVEVAAYYVVSEALTNVAKHADASWVRVDVEATDGVLRISVHDDGVGGADLAHGSGLVGLKDRVEALAGRISVDSPPGVGTSLQVELPLADDGAEGP
jgi:signal transduction histidine kinase